MIERTEQRERELKETNDEKHDEIFGQSRDAHFHRELVVVSVL